MSVSFVAMAMRALPLASTQASLTSASPSRRLRRSAAGRASRSATFSATLRVTRSASRRSTSINAGPNHERNAELAAESGDAAEVLPICSAEPAGSADGAARVRVWAYGEGALRPAWLQLREKRFLAHCRLADGDGELPDDGGVSVTAHCPNPGAMLGFALQHQPRVYLSRSANAARKLLHTLELVDVSADTPAPTGGGGGDDGGGATRPNWVNCNTMLPNVVVAAALQRRALPELQAYTAVRREVRYGGERSRVDFVLQYADGSELLLEVKNVTYRGSEGGRDDVALFPDCPTLRGQKHLRELATVASASDSATAGTNAPRRQAAVLYYISRADVSCFAPSRIDAKYRRLFYSALSCGVRALAYVFETDAPAGDVYVRPISLPVLPPSADERAEWSQAAETPPKKLRGAPSSKRRASRASPRAKRPKNQK